MSRVIVPDASAAIEAVLVRPSAAMVVDALESAHTVSVPELYFAEVANALWKHVKAGDLTPEQAQALLDEASDLIDRSTPVQELVTEALAVSTAYQHPVYDALYAVTLAAPEAQSAPWTAGSLGCSER